MERRPPLAPNRVGERGSHPARRAGVSGGDGHPAFPPAELAVSPPAPGVGLQVYRHAQHGQTARHDQRRPCPGDLGLLPLEAIDERPQRMHRPGLRHTSSVTTGWRLRVDRTVSVHGASLGPARTRVKLPTEVRQAHRGSAGCVPTWVACPRLRGHVDGEHGHASVGHATQRHEPPPCLGCTRPGFATALYLDAVGPFFIIRGFWRSAGATPADGGCPLATGRFKRLIRQPAGDCEAFRGRLCKPRIPPA